MAVEIHIEVQENLAGKLEMEFAPYQVGHMTPAEDEMTRKFLYFFRVFAGALQARAERENRTVGRISDDVMAEIVKKAMKDKTFDEKRGAIEVDITRDVEEFGGTMDVDMRAPEQGEE